MISIRDAFKGLYRLCQCGDINCLIPILNKKGKFQKFKWGHNSRGQNHPMWKGGRHPTSEGYIQNYAPDHPFKSIQNTVYEHRLVYEHYLYIMFDEHIYIPKEVDIHHKNGNVQDNSLINLESLLKSDHGSLSARKIEPDRICIDCGKDSDEIYHDRRGYPAWRKTEGGFKCYNCFSKVVNPTYGKIDRSNTFCYLCGTNKTYINPTVNTAYWYTYKNGLICKKCYRKEYVKKRKT